VLEYRRRVRLHHQWRVARFLGYAYRSLKEIATCLELSQRLFPALPADSIAALIDEANQISRMTYALIQRLGGRGDE
jgi:four helix bundle protein